MNLKYTNMDKVVIGTHTQDERKFQVTNHYNMVEGQLKSSLSFLDELEKTFGGNFKGSKKFEFEHLCDKIRYHIKNAQAQHFNEGYEIKNIDGLGVISV